jgi:hypothetical protein
MKYLNPRIYYELKYLYVVGYFLTNHLGHRIPTLYYVTNGNIIIFKNTL